MSRRSQTARRNKPLPKEVVDEIEKWAAANRPKLRSVLVRDQTLRKLFWQGCDPLPVLHFLAEFTQPGIHAARERVRGEREWLLKLAKDLRELVPRVKRAFELLIPFPKPKEDTEELPPEPAEPLSQEEQEVQEFFEELRRDFHVELTPEVHDEMLHFAEFIERWCAPMLSATVLSEETGPQQCLIAAAKFVKASTGERCIFRDLANVIVALEAQPGLDVRKKADSIRNLINRWNPDDERPTELRLRTRFRREGDDKEDDHGNDQRDDADLRPRPPLIEDEDEDEDAGDEENDDEDGGTQTFEIYRSDSPYLTDDEIADLVKRSKARWAKYWSGNSSSLPKEPDGTHQ